ncbi:hypothetical protein D6Z97_16190 [Shigella boydii]|uniref:Uncharacterized protein n=2 Tax=Shigella TaxID=620 RepID=A0A3T2UX53_SHIFL|nr:hypothetical protein ABE81_06530 [Shigella boydii]EAA0482967.1 hypothetical protein [Shigella flexneri]EFD5411539.1 hypothetical protein [Escherichia coli]EIQ44715.1 hypothetical protein SB444474_0913 [Shigella boydii 4444-74]EJZ66636.1 hypothetical protein SF148580_2107 [Shigella flexneri 1485-80]
MLKMKKQILIESGSAFYIRQSLPDNLHQKRHNCTSSVPPLTCASLPSPVCVRTAPDLIE